MSLPHRTPLAHRVKAITAERLSLLVNVPDIAVLERIVESLRSTERSRGHRDQDR